MENAEAVNTIMNTLSSSSLQAVEEYTRYFAISGAIWACVGIALLVASWRFNPADTESFAGTFKKELRVIGIALAVLMIADNAVDGLSPKAYAIHQLIGDIRGHD